MFLAETNKRDYKLFILMHQTSTKEVLFYSVPEKKLKCLKKHWQGLGKSILSYLKNYNNKKEISLFFGGISKDIFLILNEICFRKSMLNFI